MGVQFRRELGEANVQLENKRVTKRCVVVEKEEATVVVGMVKEEVEKQTSIGGS